MYHVDMGIIRVGQTGVSYMLVRQGDHMYHRDMGIIRVGQTGVSYVS